MQKKNYNLEDIENFLEDFGFTWVLRLVYNPNTNKYKEIKSNIFNGKPIFISLKNNINGKKTLMLAEIDNTTFTLTNDKYKIEASVAWQDYLNEKTLGKTNEC